MQLDGRIQLAIGICSSMAASNSSFIGLEHIADAFANSGQ
jgi:hypothetical protein